MAAAEPQSDEHIKAFFLDLAAKGKDAWNAWRRDPANKGVHVTFAGIDFFKAPRKEPDEIDFSGFEFGDNADFSECKLRRGPFRPGRASFASAVFGNHSSFDGAILGDWTDFASAAFGDYTSFIDTAFGDVARFTDATFGNQAIFHGAAFGQETIFAGAAFGDGANFYSAAFGKWTSFEDIYFKGSVAFTGKSVKQWTEVLELGMPSLDAGARAALEKRQKESWKRFGSGPDRFRTISFALLRRPPILRMRVFTIRRISMPRQRLAGSISPAPILGLAVPSVPIGLPKPKSQCDCARFEKSRKKRRTTISNATSISRNAKPNAASICVNGSKS